MNACRSLSVLSNSHVCPGSPFGCCLVFYWIMPLLDFIIVFPACSKLSSVYELSLLLLLLLLLLSFVMLLLHRIILFTACSKQLSLYVFPLLLLLLPLLVFVFMIILILIMLFSECSNLSSYFTCSRSRCSSCSCSYKSSWSIVTS